ncbi:ScbA/BarX family gamma-butyrolactone biosynthesis protein [Streptomyces sp. NPDC093510]|uniref:ScbA/BarX family gamma-butyrolactone biosynthesis protein n=1 Tax=Streptomyces sp. NPDC093510 TaxID=3155199 RepID=UPI00342904B9
MSSSLVLPQSKDAQGTRSNDTTRTDGSPAQLPRLTTTVPAEYVHRAALAEVFLTDCEKTGESTFVLTGQWPRAHTFFSTPDGRHHDHLQACETLRQTGIYLAHAEFGIPLGHHFVMQDMTVTTRPEHLAIGTAPTRLTLNTTLTRTRRSPNFTISLTITNEHGDTLSTGYGHFTCISPAAYQRLRAANPTNPHPTDPTAHTLDALRHIPTHQDPTTYGRVHPRDLVLAPTHQPHLYRLNPDPAHPILFDHDGDHIPGMVLIEAARQATHPHPDPANTHLTHTHTEFHHYVELITPCHVTSTAPVTTPTATGYTTTHTITSHQNNHPTHTTTLTHTTTHPPA